MGYTLCLAWGWCLALSHILFDAICFHVEHACHSPHSDIPFKMQHEWHIIIVQVCVRYVAAGGTLDQAFIMDKALQHLLEVCDIYTHTIDINIIAIIYLVSCTQITANGIYNAQETSR